MLCPDKSLQHFFRDFRWLRLALAVRRRDDLPRGGEPETGEDSTDGYPPTVWFSETGEQWDEAELPGPEVTSVGGHREIVSFEGGALAARVVGNDIVVWRLELD